MNCGGVLWEVHCYTRLNSRTSTEDLNIDHFDLILIFLLVFDSHEKCHGDKSNSVFKTLLWMVFRK
jgi:hypothetical protein